LFSFVFLNKKIHIPFFYPKLFGKPIHGDFLFKKKIIILSI